MGRRATNRASDSRPSEERGSKGALVFAVGIALYVLLGLVLWWLLNGYIDPSAIKDPSKEAAVKKDLIQALGLIMAGVAGAVGIFFTWRNLQQNQANLRLAQEGMERTQVGTQESLRLTREQVQLSREEQELARQGQITERFTRAIDQLGATDSEGRHSMEVRLGGIYALERIAKESEEYYWPIIEILTAYVREHGVWTPEKAVFPPDKSIPLRDAAIEAILTVLWKRSGHFGDGEPLPIVLPRIDLRSVSFIGGNFDQAVFWQANLEGAHLEEASLRGAQFLDANLAEARLSRANLEGAKLGKAYLQGANLEGANLRGADLNGARHLYQWQIEKAYGDEHTQLPSHLKQPSSWTT